MVRDFLSRSIVSYYFLYIGSMSFTQNRRGDFQGIKTREFILQNNDSSGSFPALNSILVVSDDKGTISTTQSLFIPQSSINLGELTTTPDSTGRYMSLQSSGLNFLNSSGNIKNPGEFSMNKNPVDGHLNLTTTTTGKTNMIIDETGEMILSGFSTQYNASNPNASNIIVNGNIFAAGSDSNGTGQVHTQRIVLPGDCYLWSDTQRLLWKQASRAPIHVNGWQPLLDNTISSIAMLNNASATNAELSSKIDELIKLISGRKIIFTISGSAVPQPAVTFQTPSNIKISYQNVTPAEIYPIVGTYSSISSFISTLNGTLGTQIFVYNSQDNNVSIDLPSNTFIIFNDFPQVGAAQRILNHLGLYNIVPTYGYVKLTSPVYGSPLLDISNIGYGRSWTNPTNVSGSQIGSRYITFTWIKGTDGTGDSPRYGIYNGSSITAYDCIDSATATIGGKLSYTVYGLTPESSYSFAVSTIGLYDESGNSGFINLSTISDIPISPTGITFTQYQPTLPIDLVIPIDPSTFGPPTGNVFDISLGSMLLLSNNEVQSYVYSSTFTIRYPDTYDNVYIGIYADTGESIDAYQLDISGVKYGIWKQQTLDSPQYFGPFRFVGGVDYPASIVTMKVNRLYSFGIFFIQIQPKFEPNILSNYMSPTLDNLSLYKPGQYPHRSLMQFCTRA